MTIKHSAIAVKLKLVYVIVQVRDGGLYWDFKVRVLFERGLCNPGKVRRRIFGLTSQTHTLITESSLGD